MDLPATMRGLVLRHDGFSRDTGGELLDSLEPHVALEELPLPRPGPGQVLIRVARAAVNPSDVAFIRGIYGQARRKGMPAGFEGTGTVVAGETPLLGRRVSFFGSGSGTWAEYALAEAAWLIPLRPDLRDEDAAGLIVNPLTAAAMFEIVREDGAGSFVATAGGSQLAKFLIALGREQGIPCIAVVRRDALAAPLAALGAGEVLTTGAPDFAERTRAAMAAHAPRILLDAVSDQVSSDLFFAMPRRARWIVYGGLASEPPRLDHMGQFIFREKRIEGFWLTTWLRDTPRERAAEVIADVQARFADGRWKTDVTAVVPLAEAMNALPGAYGAKDGKVLIAP